MKPVARFREGAVTIGFLALLVAFIGAVLWPGYRLADRLAASNAALRLASEQQGRPEAIASALESVRDRLGAGAYVGESIADLHRTMTSFDSALTELRGSAAGASAELRSAEALWARYQAVLGPVATFEGLPYRDTDETGTAMTAAGRELGADTRGALAMARIATPKLTEALTSIGARLQRDAAADSARLRLLMIVGVAFACAFGASFAYVQWLKRRHERAALEARHQTRDILATVKDGLFLIDAEFRVGKAHSAALGTLLGRETFDGLTFEDLLRPLVPDKTLATASKYVKLLWGERANENLIRSINPLSEVEVQIDRGEGRRDVRYLDFEFHRVRGDEGTRQVLVTVDDVTSRVLLARELKESQANAQSQLDMLLGILQADPAQALGFLDDAGAALGHVNSVLKVPARNDREFRDKIDQLFREIHRIKGEAATLGLVALENRAHDFEDALNELRQRTNLSGDDFLPMVVRLDELFSHLKSVRELVVRLDGLRVNAVLEAPATPIPSLSEAAFDRLAQRLAADHGKDVRVTCMGLEHVPADYARPLRDIAIQLVRNAVVHGIEAPAARRTAGKAATGALRLEFHAAPGGYELLFEDDGAGVDERRVRAAAVARGLVAAEQGEALDSRAVLALLFKAGFSTRDRQDRDAGRGVGLDLVRRTVQSLNGKLGVTSVPGRFTRFRLALPSLEADAQQAAG
ncbi:MAG TPA: ATP-binding protein [Steroidobacteraceae bacterium]|nr:ATP-binding protein [Steroidobacteraceae bacterium]